MKFTLVKQFVLVSTIMIAFSCDSEEENYTSQETNVLEQNISKTTKASFKARIKVINIDTGKEVNLETFKSLKIRAKNVFGDVFYPNEYRSFDLPNDAYSFYSALAKPFGERVGDYKLTPVFREIPSTNLAAQSQTVVRMEYYYDPLPIN